MLVIFTMILRNWCNLTNFNLVKQNMISITRIGGFSKMFVMFVTILTIGGIRLDVYWGWYVGWWDDVGMIYLDLFGWWCFTNSTTVNHRYFSPLFGRIFFSNRPNNQIYGAKEGEVSSFPNLSRTSPKKRRKIMWSRLFRFENRMIPVSKKICGVAEYWKKTWLPGWELIRAGHGRLGTGMAGVFKWPIWRDQQNYL